MNSLNFNLLTFEIFEDLNLVEKENNVASSEQKEKEIIEINSYYYYCMGGEGFDFYCGVDTIAFCSNDNIENNSDDDNNNNGSSSLSDDEPLLLLSSSLLFSENYYYSNYFLSTLKQGSKILYDLYANNCFEKEHRKLAKNNEPYIKKFNFPVSHIIKKRRL